MPFRAWNKGCDFIWALALCLPWAKSQILILPFPGPEDPRKLTTNHPISHPFQSQNLHPWILLQIFPEVGDINVQIPGIEN
jgi:hypothetical protein